MKDTPFFICSIFFDLFSNHIIKGIMGRKPKPLLSREVYYDISNWFKDEFIKLKFTISDLADRIGVDRQDFINRLNPTRHEEPFKFEHFIKILDHLPGVNRREILKHILSRWGFIPVADPKSYNKELAISEIYKALAVVSKEKGDVAKVVLEANQDGKFDPDEFKRIMKEITDLKITTGDLELVCIHKFNQDSGLSA